MTETGEAFSPLDWALLAAVALMWGASFLFIAVGLEAFPPTLITLLRLGFGAATLAVFPRARRAVPRSDWSAIALLGFFWMAAPLLLFPIAQQWIDSSLAGMLNGAVPLFAAAVAALLIRRLPAWRQSMGLLVGFLGVVGVSWPAVQGARSSTVGAALVILATVFYGIALNLSVPLQRRNGALPVLFRAQLTAIVMVAPFGLASVPSASFAWPSLAAIAALGSFGTALAFVGMTTLVARVGATRGSIAVYFVPVVAIVLGVLFRSETVALASLIGTGLVLLGAYLTSRRERPRVRPVPAASNGSGLPAGRVSQPSGIG
ncbi:MAG: EamA family transporter [Nitriliruptorales bacterium]|nr:EamA family transporter [Nitriliruptorales bacterium]